MFIIILLQWVLSSKEINFPYPLGLTLLHMVFSSVLCFVLTKVVPVAVFFLGVAAGQLLLIMSVISFGVLVASYGEININWIGVYQMGGVVNW
ncbi:hypothetical protein Hanom_Chr10g00934051 [Helianthus anomalus]